MKKHFISLFDTDHLWWTISLFGIGVVLIVIASIIGVSDNPPGIVLFYAGLISLFFSVLHPWKKAINYAILAGVCIGIFLLGLLVITILDKLGSSQSMKIDGILEGTVFFICIPGIVVSVIGAII